MAASRQKRPLHPTLQRSQGQMPIYAVVCCDNDAMKVRLDSRMYFPSVEVEKGNVDAYEQRLQWRYGDRVNIYCEKKIYSCDVYKMCCNDMDAAAATGELQKQLIEESLMARPNSSRMIGQCPVSVSSKADGIEADDSDGQVRPVDGDYSPSEKSEDSIRNESNIMDEPEEVTLKAIMEAVQAMRISITAGIQDVKVKLGDLDCRVSKIERCLRTGDMLKVYSSADKKKATDAAKAVNGDEFFNADEENRLKWMKTSCRDHLNVFIKSYDGPADGFYKTLALKMWGTRNLQYWKLTLADRKRGRPSLKQKDPTGYDIFLYVVCKWYKRTIGETTSAAIVDIDQTKSVWLDDIFRLTNQAGLDKKKRTDKKQESCWYWELLAQGYKPRENWTIWEECAGEDDQAHSSETDPPVLARVRELETLLKDATVLSTVQQLKAAFDEFGKKL